jgi:crotonobetainyl-CoA:carnitine CoA-transferase CaiB-like acyl-CoA transferase
MLMALVGRDRRSKQGAAPGHRIDVSMQEAATIPTFQHASANAYTWHGQVPGRRGFTGPAGGRSLYQCRDGQWLSFIVPPYRWDEFLDWLGDEQIESPVRGEAFRDRAHRQQHNGAVSETIQQLADRYDRPALFHEGQRRRLLLMPVNDVSDLAADEQLRARGFFSEVEHPALARTLVDTGAPFVFGGERPSPLRPAPALGEHNEEIFCRLLGLAADELAALRERGVV